METTNTPSKAARITGWVLTALTVLFLFVDGTMKIARSAPSVEGSTALGWPLDLVAPIGYLLTIFTILHIIPRTAVIGAILVSSYLGGAVAVMMAAGQPFYFPIIFCILMWGGLVLREPRIRGLLF